MATDILTAKVASINIGRSITIEGLKLADGRYAIASQQLVQLFPDLLLKNNVHRSVKALLGKYYLFLKTTTNRSNQRRLETAMLTSDFSELLFELLLKGDATAITLSRALIGVSIDQFWADGFDDALTSDDRQGIINRVMDKPRPQKALCGDYDLNYVANLLKCGRGSVKMALWFRDYIYTNFTPEEWEKLETVNPKNEKGIRRFTIHSCLIEILADNKQQLFRDIVNLCKVSVDEEDFIKLYKMRMAA